jgi:hypothetical protein
MRLLMPFPTFYSNTTVHIASQHTIAMGRILVDNQGLPIIQQIDVPKNDYNQNREKYDSLSKLLNQKYQKISEALKHNNVLTVDQKEYNAATSAWQMQAKLAQTNNQFIQFTQTLTCLGEEILLHNGKVLTDASEQTIIKYAITLFTEDYNKNKQQYDFLSTILHESNTDIEKALQQKAIPTSNCSTNTQCNHASSTFTR